MHVHIHDSVALATIFLVLGWVSGMGTCALFQIEACVEPVGLARLYVEEHDPGE